MPGAEADANRCQKLSCTALRTFGLCLGLLDCTGKSAGWEAGGLLLECQNLLAGGGLFRPRCGGNYGRNRREKRIQVVHYRNRMTS